jgi:hypothetical protein
LGCRTYHQKMEETVAPPAETTATTAAPAAVTAAPVTGAAPAAETTTAVVAPANLLADAATKPAETTEVKPETTEAKPVDPATQVPEAYELIAPEGVVIDEALAASYKAAAKAAGLTQEQFAKATPEFAKIVDGLRAEAFNQWTTMQNTWVSEIKADAEYGGAKLEATISEAARAVDAFGGKVLRDALKVTGAGNHPALIKAFAQIGRAIAPENKFIAGRTGTAALTGSAAAASAMFPNMK